jgi:hypothetical protein
MGGVRSFCRCVPALQELLCMILFLCFGLIGCGDSCVIFVSDPGGGTLSGGTSSCSLNPMHGNVRLRVSSSLAAQKTGGLAEVQHIFLTIRGIEATANAFADAEAPDWRELTPNLAAQPLQLDLLARSAESCQENSFESAAVPADTYRQLRLSLSSSQPDASYAAPQESLCGSAGLNCIQTSDGAIQPLVLDSNFVKIPISPEQIRRGFFQILPDTTANLRIEFDSRSSLFIPASEGVRLIPVFSVDAQTACQSIDAER